MPDKPEWWFVLSVGICLAFIWITVAIFQCSDPRKAKPCTDYSYKLSRLPGNKKLAVCDKWPGMAMKIDRRLLSGTLVSCTCPRKEPP